LRSPVALASNNSGIYPWNPFMRLRLKLHRENPGPLWGYRPKPHLRLRLRHRQGFALGSLFFEKYNPTHRLHFTFTQEKNSFGHPMNMMRPCLKLHMGLRPKTPPGFAQTHRASPRPTGLRPGPIGLSPKPIRSRAPDLPVSWTAPCGRVHSWALRALTLFFVSETLPLTLALAWTHNTQYLCSCLTPCFDKSIAQLKLLIFIFVINVAKKYLVWQSVAKNMIYTFQK